MELRWWLHWQSVCHASVRTPAWLPEPTLKSETKGWRDGSAVKSTDFSSTGPEFNSQQSLVYHNHLSWDLMPPFGVSEDNDSIPTYMK